ncbi:MAG: hypothetical protein AABY22_35405 [Nanoarchaeota archaeon]
MENSFITTHNLDFEAPESPYSFLFGDETKLFRIGTCTGQWGCNKNGYYILSVINDEPGNGHLNDVFEWFEFSSKRDNKNLLVLECMNNRFYNHLISKRGFNPIDKNNVIKILIN